MDRLAVRVRTLARIEILSILLLAATACATIRPRQEAIPIEEGQRVRITLASRVATGRLQGTVASFSPDSLVVAREEGGERRLSRSQVESVEVSVTRTVEPVKAAGYGVLTAAPLIIPVFLVLSAGVCECGGAAFWYLLGPVAAAGAVGALIGSGPQDVWVDALWPTDLRTESSDSLAVEPD
jgi:hypothetical protein